MENNRQQDAKLLSVKDLYVEYTQEGSIVSAVNGVSFELNDGETLGLVGETGAGKTTIAKAILRLLPDPPSRIKAGQIFFEGTELLGLPEEQMRAFRGNKIAMIFQDPMTALNPVKRVGEQIAEGLRINMHMSKAEAKAEAIKMLEMVGIAAERYREYPHQFSGGMKQRVVIAIALACDPKLLIADEPTTALDVTIQAQVLDLIKSLQKKKQTAMIMITHDFGIVAETCDKVAVVYAGKIVEYGTKRQILKNPLHPYTTALFDAIPSLEEVERLKPIKGMPTDPTDLPPGCAFAPRCPFATEACSNGEIPLADVGDGHVCRCRRLNEIAAGNAAQDKQEV